MRTMKKMRSGMAVLADWLSRRGPEIMSAGAHRQATGVVCSLGEGGVGELSLLAVREIPRMYPPRLSVRMMKTGISSGVTAENFFHGRKLKAAVG
jgi:hypothetical protein|tara:strand:- start:14 stop:298 length:285 start_codon:yes stop_codon:yes gene_type:complete